MKNYRAGPEDDPEAGEVDVIDDDAAQPEHRESRVGTRDHGQRLDKWLVALAPEFSRSHLQTLIEDGHVLVDGQPASSASRKVSAGQGIAVTLHPTPQSQAFRAEPMTLAVVFEDEHLMVIDKPAGLVVHPAAGHWSGTLLNGLLAHHRGAALLPRAGIVHRLDKDTSGLMVVGKTLQAVTALVREIAAREVHREYLALAHGVPNAARFTIHAPIGRDPVSRVRMAVVASGRAARTDVEVLTHARMDLLPVSLLRCTLHTGRTHQIRVHLASRGHPLVADATYGGREALGLTRQALHARRLRFTHPVLGTAVGFEAAPPSDLQAALAQLPAVGF